MKIILPIAIIGFFLGVALATGGFILYHGKIPTQVKKEINELKLENIKLIQKNDQMIEAKQIPYVSCTDGTCIIPKASGLPSDPELACIWNYWAGNGGIPYIDVTRGTLSLIEDAGFDVSVFCRDVNGNIYFGNEDEERP